MLSFYKKEKEKKKNVHHWPLYLAAVFFILADIVAASYFIFEEYYSNKIYPGVSLGQIQLGGKTADEANAIMEARLNDLNQSGVQFAYDQEVATITPIITSFNGDIALQVINLNTDETVKGAMAVGRSQGAYANFKQQAAALLRGYKILADIYLDSEQIKRMLVDSFGQFAAPPADARLYATTSDLFGQKRVILAVAAEKMGYDIDYDQGILQLQNKLENLEISPIVLSAAKGYPTIKKNEAEPLAAVAQKLLDKSDLTLAYAGKKWPVPKDQAAAWFTVLRATGTGQTMLGLDESKFQDFLDKTAAPQIEVPPADARFQIINGKVVQFNQSASGHKIDLEQTYKNLQTSFLAGGGNTVDIAMATVTSEISNEATNNLGITELVGEGHSNFSLSPKNRIHNIGVGAAAMNGLLIPPGTEFSTDKALGEVTAATGYLPEMTIMGDKTVPQEGGGLCQIGTTMFRAALASGFPITARQAHSYRVVYYEPAGTDATIYQPWPDLRFINDSKNYILIQTHISGNDLYFDFWGTKDGRVVEQSDPTIYNITKPQPTKYTETLSLPLGQKKCTERAHNGADAFFDYKVTYPDGTVKQKRFTSHYVPWREVCLIGVTQLSSTSTPAVIPTP